MKIRVRGKCIKTTSEHPSYAENKGWVCAKELRPSDRLAGPDGQWISEDPLGFNAGDSNLYRYATNRPTYASDPSGLFDWTEFEAEVRRQGGAGYLKYMDYWNGGWYQGRYWHSASAEWEGGKPYVYLDERQSPEDAAASFIDLFARSHAYGGGSLHERYNTYARLNELPKLKQQYDDPTFGFKQVEDRDYFSADGATKLHYSVPTDSRKQVGNILSADHNGKADKANIPIYAAREKFDDRQAQGKDQALPLYPHIEPNASYTGFKISMSFGEKVHSFTTTAVKNALHVAQVVAGTTEMIIGLKTVHVFGLGLLLIAHGADQVNAGVMAIVTQKDYQTFTSKKITEYAQDYGLKKDAAEALGQAGDALVGIVLTAGAGTALHGADMSFLRGFAGGNANAGGITFAPLSSAGKGAGLLKGAHAIQSLSELKQGMTLRPGTNSSLELVGSDNRVIARANALNGTSASEAVRSLRVLEQSCFVAGTPLLTPAGSKPIEQFRAGDRILSRSEHNVHGPVHARVIERVFIRTAPVIAVRVGGRLVRTTAEHPFYLENKGWVCARELKPGDRLASHDGQWITVEAVTDLNEVATVYNLRVSDYHTYFVGSREWGFSVWAHNTCFEVRRLSNGRFGLFNRATGLPELREGIQITGNTVENLLVRAASEGVAETAIARAFATGAAGEVHLASLFPGARTQVSLPTGIGTGAGRFRHVDVLSGGIAHESKVGFTTLTELVESQIAKDAWLIRNNPDIRGATWHFFRSAETGRIGAAPEVLQALDRNGIRYIIHE